MFVLPFDGRFAFVEVVLPEVFEPLFVFDIFVFDGGTVAIGVGLDMVLRFVLVLFVAVLFVAASPHAAPSAPSAKTAVSAIFFIILDYSPVFFKV